MKDLEFRLSCQPEQLSSLRLTAQEFGFAYLHELFDVDLINKLHFEAASQLNIAVDVDIDGDLRFRARMAKLGDVAQSVLRSRQTRMFLQTIFDEILVVADGASCFTYYQGGDYLGLHRDRPEVCLVTMIIYLSVVSPDPEAVNTGLVLRVFNKQRPLCEEPRMVIPTSVGTVVIGRGSEIWHERPQLRKRESVVALTGCYCKAVSPVD